MRFPVNLVLEIRTQEEYDRVQETLQLLRSTADGLVEEDKPALNLELLDRVVLRLTDASKESRVLINGHPIAFGTTEEMTKRYKTEEAMHQRSNVVLEEWKDGDYQSTKSRRLQKF